MNYPESREYLKELLKVGSIYGLETMGELLKRLGDPQRNLRFVHIAGTNGKGSVLSYLTSVLSEAGYCTGSYTSPALFSYRERYRVNNVDIKKEEFAACLTEVAEAAEHMRAEKGHGPTCFEVETAVALLYFSKKHCDLVVLETGMGGSLDATNIVDTTVVAVLTSIGMDHMEYLGSTLGEIAAQKAGILKPGAIAVSAVQSPEAAAVIQAAAADKGCSLRFVQEKALKLRSSSLKEQHFDYGPWNDITIHLAGTYQPNNAALALEAILALRRQGFQISDEQVRSGMAHTEWKGRFTPISEKPMVILDGAHNEAAAIELKKSIELYFKGRRIFYMMGVFRDKEYEKIISCTAPLASYIVTIQTPKNPRALPATELKQAVERVNPSVEAADSIAMGVQQLFRRMEPEDVLIVFGSLSFLEEAEKCVKAAMDGRA